MEREAARSGPRPFVDIEDAAKGDASAVAEHAPCRDHVEGRIADTRTAEVDHGLEPAALNKQVGSQ